MEAPVNHNFLNSLIPWVCVDLEINPETRQLIRAAVLFDLGNSLPVRKTFESESEHEFLGLLRRLLTSDAVLIGHNLRRHDLVWLTEKDHKFGEHPRCIDTLELFPAAYPSIRSYRLEKPYRDPKTDPLIKRKKRNHPALDCDETVKLLESILEWFNGIQNPDLAQAYRALLGHGGAFAAGNRALFGESPEIDPLTAFENALSGNFCHTAWTKIKTEELAEERAKSLAYLLSLIPADIDSKPLPPRPWVRYTFPEIVELITKLRGTNCGECEYCHEKFDLVRQMEKIFGFDGWRNEGQRIVTESVMKNRSVLGVLPTSGGKSLTFQLPALIRANATGALTVVISPLRSLMDDQVDKLKNEFGRDDVCQISGSLNSLERVRNLRSIHGAQIDEDGSNKTVPAHIVYIAPEQLRSVSVTRAIGSRGIGLLVIDEAHCIAKWGKDFRTEYRFIPEMIDRLCKEHQIPTPQVLCLTATARHDVLEEIRERFKSGMGVNIDILDHGHERENLDFECLAFEEGADKEKFETLLKYLEPIYHADEPSLLFCGTRAKTENLVTRLKNNGIEEINYYHGDCSTEHRKDVQEKFLHGDLRVVVATNAFGMGVDKKDIRLIVHYDIPGSLENYIQEAGRAGRDGKKSKCVLFYDPKDLDMQLDMQRRKQLRLQELKRVILVIRHRHDRAVRQGDEFPEIIISARDLAKGKIALKELRDLETEDKTDESESIARFTDDEDDSIDLKVKTALGILEESNHLKRLENVIKPISVPFRVTAWDRIERLIYDLEAPEKLKLALLHLAEYLFYRASEEDGQPVDLEVLADNLTIGRDEVEGHIDKLRAAAVCFFGKEFTIEWFRHCADSSVETLAICLDLLGFMIDGMEKSDISYALKDETKEINIDEVRQGSRSIEGGGYPNNLAIVRDLHLLADWGLFTIENRQRGKMKVKWTGSFDIAKEHWNRLSYICKAILSFLDTKQDNKGGVTTKFVYTDFEKWQSSNKELFNEPVGEGECEDALLFMHKHGIVNVVDGFSVLRARMKIKPTPARITDDYRPAYSDYLNYTKTTIAQVKAIERFAEKLSKDKNSSTQYLNDYFSLPWSVFTIRHFTPGERKNLSIPLRKEHFEREVGKLTKEQLTAVQAKTNANHLIIAGPGSGKTHVLVLRIFYLIKVRNVPAKSIAVLAYNRHASIELRRRLKMLLPKDWYDIGVHTFHGLALRLIGHERLHELQSDAKNDNAGSEKIFDTLLIELADALKSSQGDEEHAQLNWLDRLNGIEYLLVDEFQDIGEKEYDIIKLLARLGRKSREGAVNVMAVGDDDQNLYEFRGSSVDWIRHFQNDFETGDPIFLPDNFRSVQSVIEISSGFIATNQGRLKPINWTQKVPEKKKAWETEQIKRDPDGCKAVILNVADEAEARSAIASEISLIKKAFSDINLGDICIAHQTNAEAHLSKLLLNELGYQAKVYGERPFAPRYERGVVEVISELEKREPDESNISYGQLEAIVNGIFNVQKIHQSWRTPWEVFFDEAMMDIAPDYQIPVRHMLWRIDEHLSGRTDCAVSPDALACLTLHGTKGLQFHTVFLFPPAIHKEDEEDVEALRRLYFVGISRAKVKVFLLDWPDCDRSIWTEILESGSGWINQRKPKGKLKPTDSNQKKLAKEFSYFNTRKLGLGTGMNIFWLCDQQAITTLLKDQQIEPRPGITLKGNPKIEFFAGNKIVGMLKNDAVNVLSEKVQDKWDRILRVEVAQVLQTETPEDQREYNNGNDRHYYIVPRIFYCRV